MVGAARLELTTPRSQSECATNCAMPRQNFRKIRKDTVNLPFFMQESNSFSSFKFGVNSGARTHGPQSHNLMLYQLSYIHHISYEYMSFKLKKQFRSQCEIIHRLLFRAICHLLFVSSITHCMNFYKI